MTLLEQAQALLARQVFTLNEARAFAALASQARAEEARRFDELWEAVYALADEATLAWLVGEGWQPAGKPIAPWLASSPVR